mmetsp:Transcript_10524/g.13343  ORF Transcript_10524/g.13343 Transcript_10524/m.13343 type:complete len:85 (-) Transcript_10524:1200-1454(-)
MLKKMLDLMRNQVGTATEHISTTSPIIVTHKLCTNVLIVSGLATAHSPRILLRTIAHKLVIIMSSGHPTDAAIFSGSKVVAHSP